MERVIFCVGRDSPGVWNLSPWQRTSFDHKREVFSVAFQQSNGIAPVLQRWLEVIGPDVEGRLFAEID
jgi:hypothetical protein